MVKAIVFDFDGVIVRDSESFKATAWREMFPPDTPLGISFAEAEKRFGRGRGGDRYDILRATLGGHGWEGAALEEMVREHASLFDEKVQRAIVDAGARSEDVVYLRGLATRYPLFLNSATPVEALEKTVHALGLSAIFGDRILGRPRTKVENFGFVAAYCGCGPSEILFVGDSSSDGSASMIFGSVFIGFRNVSNDWDGCVSFPMIDSISELERFLA